MEKCPKHFDDRIHSLVFCGHIEMKESGCETATPARNSQVAYFNISTKWSKCEFKKKALSCHHSCVEQQGFFL